VKRRIVIVATIALLAFAIAVGFRVATKTPVYPQPRVTTTKCVEDKLDGSLPQPTPCPFYVTGG
jgi:hypothetical protein